MSIIKQLLLTNGHGLEIRDIGLPSIVSNINGCNEIIVEEKNGSIIPVKNTAALSQAMHKLYSDKTHYETLKTHARSMIQSRYEQQIIWNALLEEYESLIQKLGGRKQKLKIPNPQSSTFSWLRQTHTSDTADTTDTADTADTEPVEVGEVGEVGEVREVREVEEAGDVSHPT
ncbi:MAG TPA: glycosyltransferase [Moheibacter sp.]|nr:glycosyltransferase [Moheibacter sp.]